MPNPNRVHRTNINRADFNFLVFTLLTLAFIISLYLSWKQIPAGYVYSLMFIGVWVLMGMTFFWIKDDNSMKPITNYFKIPIATKNTLATFFYLLGMILPVIIKLIIVIVGLITKSPKIVAYKISNFAIPLFGAPLRTAFQSFATSQIGSSMAWKLFVIMFGAGTIETLAYNFGLPIFGIIIGLFTWDMLTKESGRRVRRNVTVLGLEQRPFVMIISFGISVVAFVLSHLINGTYTFWQFWIAGAFLLIANISIYLAGVFLSFWMGYHQVNNLIYLVETEGLKAVAQGFVSWFGVIYLFFLGIIIYFVIRNWDRIVQDLDAWADGRMSRARRG